MARSARARVLALTLGIVALCAGMPAARGAGTGTGWVVQASPDAITGMNPLEGVVAISPTDAWAVGTYTAYGDNHGKVLLEHWNGTKWKIVAGQNPGAQANELFAAASTAADDVWAVGTWLDVGAQCPTQTLIEHWNGTKWKVVSSPNPLPCNNLFGANAISRDDAWAVGQTFDGHGTTMPLAAHWDGSSWSVVDEGLGFESIGFDSVSADSSDDVWAVGDIIARWDGSTWHVLGNLPQDGTTRGIAAIAPNDVWIVGTQIGYHRGDKTFTEHWDGTSWTVVPSPNKGRTEPNGELRSVTALAHDDVWAVGVWSKDGVGQTLVLHWNGVKWSISHSPNPEAIDVLDGVAGIPGSKYVWAVGEASAGVVGQTDTLALYHAG